MTNSEVKIILIDWFGTSSISTFWESWQDPAHPNHLLSEPINNTFKNQYDDLIAPWMRGKKTAEQVCEILAQSLGIKYKLLFSELIASAESMKFISSRTPELIQQLRSQKKEVIIATDNMDTFHRWTVGKLGLSNLVDGILTSASLGALKGDFDDQGRSLFFGPFMECRGLNPDNVIILDDSPKTPEIAQRLGIHYNLMEFGTGLPEALEKLV